ncbi:MAG: conjugal transfer protein TraH [Betaproteobacteria bacterium]|nr:conjugal transfer protein TraH [Betaproteobacteria bacterium]
MKIHRLTRQVLAALMIGLWVTPPASADLQGEVGRMFNDLGGVGNVTSGGSFRTQAANIYTGGNLMLRMPNKTYTLGAVQWPSIRAGCGGIDAFAGSFSHISSSELRDMLKKITSSLPAVAFQLALSSVSPLLGEKTQWMQTIEQALTRGHINSCETATALVKSAADAMNFDAAASCRRAAIALGLASDESEAASKCRQNPDAVLGQARNSNDPAVKATAPFQGNLMWEALSRLDGSLGQLDDSTRLVVMSFTGTVVYGDAGSDTPPRQYAPTISSIRELLYGRTAADATGMIEVSLYDCDTGAGCNTVNLNSSYRFKPFTKLVEERLRSLAAKAQARAVPSPEEIAFVNAVTEPVFRILNVGNTIDGSGLTDQLIEQYKEVIAIDFAHTFIERALRIGLNGLGNNYKLDKSQQADEALLRQRLSDALRDLAAEKQAAYEKVRTFNSIAQHLASLEAALRNGLPDHVQKMLGERMDDSGKKS